MIIIKPDLVIKWANSNLVLHRVRERRRCVFLRVPAPSYIFIFLNFLFDCARQSLIVCMRERVREKEREGERETVCQGKKVLQRKGTDTHIFIYTQRNVCLGIGDCYHPPPGKKEENTHKHSPHPFSFSSLFSILHLLCSAPCLLPFCITYKGSCFLQNEATYGRYANEIIARGLEWDTIYPKSWLSIMAGD